METQENESLENVVDDLKRRVAELELFNRTLLRLLTQKSIVGPNEFKNQMDELDLEDGKLNRQ